MVDDRIPPEDYYARGKGMRRGEISEEVRYKEGILAWTWYKFKEKFLYKPLPIFWTLVFLLSIGAVAYGLYSIADPASTRLGVALEKSGAPEKARIAIRDAWSWGKGKALGTGAWEDPGAREERVKRGLEIVSFGPRGDLPTNVGEEVETVADVKVYALDKEDFGTSKISFDCSYEDGESGRIVVDGVETKEVYASNDREEIFNIRCILPAVGDIEEEVEIKEANFYASYEDFITVSTLHASVLGEEEYLSREKEGTLLDFLRENSVYPNLIQGDRRAVSVYTNGPVKLAIATNKLPLTENRLYSFFVSFTPEITEWAGDIAVKQIELSVLPEVFSITKCDFATGGIWDEEFLENCDDGCERMCDFNVVGVDEFLEYEVKARAIYDYTIKDVSTVTIRKVA